MRTSDNHGTELKAMYELWGNWLESMGNLKDAMWYVMLDGADEFQACIFNSLCGFYRVAASCLRSALELIVIGTYFQLKIGTHKLLEWKEGKIEIFFGKACDNFISHTRTKPLNDYIKNKMNYSIFNQKSKNNVGGWARYLYSELSNFAHSKPTYSSGSMWAGSNGPIYIPSSFKRIHALYLDTMALAYILVKLARPTFKIPKTINYLFQSSQVAPSKVAVLSYEFLWESTIKNILRSAPLQFDIL